MTPEQRARRALALAARHYLAQLRRDWRVALPAMLLPGVGNVLVHYAPALVVAVILQQVADGEVIRGAQIVTWTLWFTGIWFTGEAVWRIAIHLLNRTDERGMRALYKRSLGDLLAKDLGFFHDNFSGALTKKAVGYARHYEGFIDTVTFSVVANIVPLPFVAVVLWRFSPWLVVTLVTMSSLTFVAIFPLMQRRQILVDQREAASNQVAGHIADTITNIEAVRAFAREGVEEQLHQQNVDDYMDKSLRSWDFQNLRVDVATSPLYVLTNALGLVIALSIGSGDGGPGIAGVFLTFSYYGQFTRVLWEFNDTYKNLEAALTEAAQFTEVLIDPPVLVDPSPAQPLEVAARADVEFSGVRFGYPGESVLLDGFDLHIADGERVGLVGRSGGGKTTLTRLLLRFMDVEAGHVMVAGHDVATITQADLRSMLGYVPQDPIMFHRSLGDNIRIGRPDASDDEVAESARQAHALDFIERLPQGFDTLVGERGVKLSGGQRQRIAIARAMLRNAPILVLDEATSSLDSESEDHIQEAMWRLMADRTAIVIAHRLSTVRQLDRLLVLDHGRLAEQGQHDDLISAGGIYASLWSRQSGGFLTDEVAARSG